jgi:hypothetical protein
MSCLPHDVPNFILQVLDERTELSNTWQAH